MLSLLVKKSVRQLEAERDAALAWLEHLHKAHVKGYTRKDGTFVKEHDDSRKAHAVGTKVRITADQHPDHGSEATVKQVHPNLGIGGRGVPGYTLSGIDGPVGHGEIEPVEEDAEPGHHGSDERDTYGVHFKPGEKVRDVWGKTHTVTEHSGPVVHVEGQSEHFHPSKLRRVDALHKAQVKGYTRKDGTFVAAHQDKRPNAKASAPAAAGEAPDHGHMRFSSKYGHDLASERILHVNKDKIHATIGNMRFSLASMAGFHAPGWQDGDAEKERRFKQAIRDAYNSSGGDPQKVLAGIKKHLGDIGSRSWTVHSHKKPDA